MNIDKIIEVLNYLNMDYKITHTNDYSELKVPSNNELCNQILLFDCTNREVYDISEEREEE